MNQKILSKSDAWQRSPKTLGPDHQIIDLVDTRARAANIGNPPKGLLCLPRRLAPLGKGANDLRLTVAANITVT